MKRMIAVLLLLPLLACAGGSTKNNAFKALEAARHTYTSLQAIAIDMQERGLISTREWNDKVVPLDNKINTALVRAYGMLRLYLAVGNEADLQQFASILRDITKGLAEFQSLLDSHQQPDHPAAGRTEESHNGSN